MKKFMRQVISALLCAVMMFGVTAVLAPVSKAAEGENTLQPVHFENYNGGDWVSGVAFDYDYQSKSSAETISENSNAKKVFMPGNTTAWNSAVVYPGEAWVTGSFSAPTVISRVDIIGPSDSTYSSRMSRLRIQASVDGIRWTNLRQNIWNTTSPNFSCTVSDTTAYNYIRIINGQSAEDLDNGKPLYGHVFSLTSVSVYGQTVGTRPTASTTNALYFKNCRIVYDSTYASAAKELVTRFKMKFGVAPTIAEYSKSLTLKDGDIYIGSTMAGNSNFALATRPSSLGVIVKRVGNFVICKSGGIASMRQLFMDLPQIMQQDFFPENFEFISSYANDWNLNKTLTEGSNLRVMSCNLLGENDLGVNHNRSLGGKIHINERKEIFVGDLNFYDPSIVAVCETTHGWYDTIDALDSNKWGCIRKATSGGYYNASYYMTAVVYRKDRLTLIASGCDPYKTVSTDSAKELRAMTWGVFEVKATGSRFVFISTHWDTGSKPTPEQGAVAQTAQANEFVAKSDALRTKYNCPVISAGDFNDGVTTITPNPFTTYCAAAGCKDARLTASTVYKNNGNGECYGTWHELGLYQPGAKYLDHITMTKEVESIGYKTLMENLQTYVSDHCFILADLKLPEHKHNMSESCTGTGVTFQPLQQTSGTLPAGNYYLSENLKLSGNMTVSSGTVNLCLNGCALNAGNYQIVVAAGATLKVCDCSQTHLSGSIASTAASAAAIKTDGEVKLYGGSITGYYGVHITNGGTADICGGALVANGASTDSDALYVYKGSATVSGNASVLSDNGHGISVTSLATLTVSGSPTVIGVKNAFTNSGTAILSGGSFINSSGVAIWNQGTIYLSGNCSVTGTRGISNVKYNLTGNLYLSGGSINGTTEYAVCSDTGVLYLNGAPVLNGTKADIYLGSGKTIQMIGALTSAEPFKIATQTIPTASAPVTVTSGWSNYTHTGSLESASSAYQAQLLNGEIVLGHQHQLTATDNHDGTHTLSCSGCSYTSTVSHTWSSDAVTIESTCTTAGSKTYSCTACTASNTETISALGHDVIIDAAVPATCTTAGLTAGQHCSRCDGETVAQETIPALGHDIIIDAAVPATCTTAGLTAGQHCSRCEGETVVQETVPALGHVAVADEAVPATCIETGLTAGSHCSVCGEMIKAQEEIPTLGHTPAEAVEENRVEPTCKAAGHYDTVVYCAVCHAELSRETTGLPMTEAHIPGEAIVEYTVAATCVTPGSYELVSYCIVCGERVFCIPGTVPATGKHTAVAPVQENAVPATCTVVGSYENVTYCKDCGTELSRETVSTPALGHQYGAPVDNGNGTHTSTCSCGDTFTEAHSFVNGICICGAEEATFGIVSASLRLDRNIDIIFHATVPEGAQNIKLMVGTENDTVTLTDFEKDGSSLRFIYADLNPQQIGDLLTVSLFAKIDGKMKYDTLDDYSIRQYCVNLLNDPKYSEDAKLHTLLSDLLTYGAAAQTYMDYKTNALVTDGLNLNPSTFAPISGKTVSFTGTADVNTDWIGAGLVLNDSVTMRYSFCAASTENLSVKVCINGREETFTDFETDSRGLYYIDFNGIEATEFDDTVSATFYRNGGKLGRTVNYSANTYICSTQNSTDTNLQALVRALYNYGVSAEAYMVRN